MTHEKLSDWTDVQLGLWIEKFIEATFPNHKIDYWSLGAHENQDDQAVPLRPLFQGAFDARFLCVVAYVEKKGREADFLKVDLMRQDKSLWPVATGKSFDTDENNWRMAYQLNKVLSEAFLKNKCPSLSEFLANKNIAFTYHYSNLYRDKTPVKSAQLVFPVKDLEAMGMTLAEAERAFSDTMDEGEFFIVGDVDAPLKELLPSQDELIESDNCWHNFGGLQLVDADSTPVSDISLSLGDLLHQFKKVDQKWLPFDVHDFFQSASEFNP